MQPDMTEKLQERLREIIQLNNEQMKGTEEPVAGEDGQGANEEADATVQFTDNMIDKNF